MRKALIILFALITAAAFADVNTYKVGRIEIQTDDRQYNIVEQMQCIMSASCNFELALDNTQFEFKEAEHYFDTDVLCKLLDDSNLFSHKLSAYLNNVNGILVQYYDDDYAISVLAMYVGLDKWHTYIILGE